MASKLPFRLNLHSTSGVSLNDRFTGLERTARNAASNRTAMQQQQQASIKNQRLAQQMANRPGVQTAVQSMQNRKLHQRLGVQARIRGRGASYGTSRGRGFAAARRGTGRGYTLRGVRGSRGRGFSSGRLPRGRGAVTRGVQGNRGVARAGYRGSARGTFRGTQSRGFARGRGVARGQGRTFRGAIRGGRGRGAGAAQTPVTKDALDSELDAYMSNTKSHLDSELDAYMQEKRS